VTRTKVFDPDRSAALLFELGGRGGRRPLVRFPASEPVFSPDGSQLVLVRHSISRRRNVRSFHSDLYLVDASGVHVRQLTDTRWIAETHPSWDPSGQRIAFSSFRIARDPLDALFDELLPFGNSIVQINADGTCRTKLISLRDAGTFAPRWQPGQGREAGRIECGVEPANRAPGGPRLALMRFDLSSFRFELETVDERGGRPFPLAGGGEWRRPLPAWFTSPAWSPDGSNIVFAGVARRLFGGPRGTRLYVSRSDGRLLHPLRGTHGADRPVFAEDGDTVAFTRYRFRESTGRKGKKKFVPRGSSIWLVDLDGGAPKRITSFRQGVYMYPTSFSPSGRTLLATREVDRRAPEAVALEPGTGGIKTVVRHSFDPTYSPDGRRIAFVRERSLERGNGDDLTTTDLFTVKAGGGGLRHLTSGRKDDFFPSWDPSGERIAFVRYRPEVTERDEIGIADAVMEVNADGSCLRSVLKPSRNTTFYGTAWQPGLDREAGRIVC
jgi:Tol biopolymer transport system component